MNQITKIEPANTRDFALAITRTALARVRMLQLEIEECGAALRFNMITAETAVSWLDDIGAMSFVTAGTTGGHAND